MIEEKEQMARLLEMIFLINAICMAYHYILDFAN